MDTRRSRGIDSSEIRCLPGSVRIRRIESARAVLVPPRLSEPSTSVACGVVRMLPVGARAALVRLSRRIGVIRSNVPAAVHTVGLGPLVLGHDPVMLATAMIDSSRSPVVGVDLGGTSIKAALVSPEYRMLARNAVPTDLRSQPALLDAIERLIA